MKKDVIIIIMLCYASGSIISPYNVRATYYPPPPPALLTYPATQLSCLSPTTNITGDKGKLFRKNKTVFKYGIGECMRYLHTLTHIC